MSNYWWVCPKCGHTLQTSVNPKYTSVPVHNNMDAHHHGRDVPMQLKPPD